VTFEFSYLHDKPAVHDAITQAIGAATMCWDAPEGAGGFQVEQALAVAAATDVEVRRIITFKLAGLLDAAGVAEEWNEGIETAIRLVETMP
jgi:hypothetical protein